MWVLIKTMKSTNSGNSELLHVLRAVFTKIPSYSLENSALQRACTSTVVSSKSRKLCFVVA